MHHAACRAPGGGFWPREHFMATLKAVPTLNQCPACGRVADATSSRYCERHLNELLLRWAQITIKPQRRAA